MRRENGWKAERREGEGKEGRREGGRDLPDQCLTASYAPGNELRKRRVDTISCFNVRSKADVSQLNLPARSEPTAKKWKREKLNSEKTDKLKTIGQQSGESGESVLKKKKRKVTVGRHANYSGKAVIK